MADQAPTLAAAETIQRVFGVPARTVRRWAATGAITKPQRGRYDVRQVLDERDRRQATRRAA